MITWLLQTVQQYPTYKLTIKGSTGLASGREGNARSEERAYFVKRVAVDGHALLLDANPLVRLDHLAGLCLNYQLPSIQLCKDNFTSAQGVRKGHLQAVEQGGHYIPNCLFKD